MKKYLFPSMLALCLAMFWSCEKDYLKSDDGSSTEDADNDNDDDGDTSVHEQESDYVWDAASVVTLTLNGTSITASGEGVSISGSTATIKSAGNYRVTGTLTNGQLLVNTKDDEVVRLILDGASVTCSTSASLYVQKAHKVVVVLNNGTENYLTDGATYQGMVDNEPNAALFSKADLSIFGEGALTVKANYADGIASKDGLVIKSGTLSVTAADDGIRGKDYLIVRSGTLTVKSTGDGLKSDNESNTALGYIQIDDCTATVTSTADAIAAQTDVRVYGGTFTLTSGGGSSQRPSGTVSSKGIKGISLVQIDGGTFTINSSDDAIHSNEKVIINNGTINASSYDDGVHADAAVTVNGGTLNVLKSYEAVESALITINAGYVNLLATNDGFNATKGTVSGGTESNDGSYLYINGGTVAVACTAGDAIDCNGNLVITGGLVIANGPSGGVEEAVDFNGTFQMKGGFFIGSGSNSNMTKAMSTSSTQKNLYLTSTSQISSSTLLRIQDASGNEILTFKPKYGGYKFLFSSEALATGVTYSVYTGGSYTGGTSTEGLFTGGAYTASGSAKKSFTISGTVTSVSFQRICLLFLLHFQKQIHRFVLIVKKATMKHLVYILLSVVNVVVVNRTVRQAVVE